MIQYLRSAVFPCWLVFVLMCVFSPKDYAQFEGISVHTDFLSINIPSGFDNNYIRPGNFLGGLQYNFPTSPDFEINTGFDFFYAEAIGTINNESRQIEFFIPSIFAGVVFNFDTWGIFGKIGYSPAGSINKHDNKSWVSTIPGFDMYPVQIGVKYNIYKGIDLTASFGNYIGNSINIDDHTISLTTMNIGLSFNLFGSRPDTPVIDNSVDNYKQMYNDLLVQNEKLEKQNTNLIKKVDGIIDRLNKTGNTNALAADSVSPPLQIKSISIDSINLVYNLHIGQSLSMKNFVNKNGVSDDGKLILGEYNSIAASFKGFPSGIWLICSVPDTNAFITNKNEFPRIDFKYNPGTKKTLVINLDVNKTESNNGIKLEIK